MAAAIAADAATAADEILKTGEVSAMLKLGFLPSSPSPPPSSSSSERHRHESHPSTKSPLPSKKQRLTLAAWIPDARDGDVRLTVRGTDGFGVKIRVHREVLVRKSRFFAEKLVAVDRKCAVEICDCDDVEVYVEVVALMYCRDLRGRIGGMGVGKVLSLLKVSEAVMFDEGVASCLTHIESVPWSKVEEDKIMSSLSQAHQYRPVSEILQRVYMEPFTSSQKHGIISRILVGVLHAKDEKARREMKSLVLKLLKEDEIGKNAEEMDTLYSLCHKCLTSIILCLSEAVGMQERKQYLGSFMDEIAREVDNLLWIVQILINKRRGEEFVSLWADQKELEALHSKLPCVYRFAISKITAQLCVAIGQGQILVPKDERFSLLQTWLGVFYADFGWIRRSSRFIDRNTMEDGLSRTILTLSMEQQQMLLLNWFERFLNNGDDCPNIYGAFVIWWRRAFDREYVEDPPDRSQLQMAAVHDYSS